jgi:SET domain-containing protein
MQSLTAPVKTNIAMDRQDYAAVLDMFGFTETAIRGISENADDQMDMPAEWANTVVKDSSIEGRGMFLLESVLAGAIIAPARLNGKRTPAGRYVNHSVTPNCFYVKTDYDSIYIVSKCDIRAYENGGYAEELTIDYRQANEL